MVTETALLRDLQAIVGSDFARAPDEPRFEVDGLSPQAVIDPASYEEVASVMRFANEHGLAVIPWGSGNHMNTGNFPGRYDIALSLSRLNQIVEHEPADLTVTCQAGMTVGELNRQLLKSGQMTPFGPWEEDTCTVGGLVAANQNLMRLAYGGARDFTIGMRVVTADGRITRAGGKVVKNVAGYDLCKLYVGSRGTLGVIVEVSFKLVPLPEWQESIHLEFESVRSACDFAREVLRPYPSLCRAHVHRYFSIPTGWGDEPQEFVIPEFSLAGTTAGVEQSRREIRQLSGHLDEQRPDTPFFRSLIGHSRKSWAWRADEPLLCQASVLPSRVIDLAELLDREIPGARLDISPLEGTMLAVWLVGGNDETLVSNVRATVARMNGTVIVSHCSPELKQRIDVFGDPPPSIELMRRVKQEFDPSGTLSPGRFVGRL